MLDAGLVDRVRQSGHQGIDNRTTERSSQTGFIDGLALLLGVVRKVNDCGLESRERKVHRCVLDVADRQLVRIRIATDCHLIDLGATRITDTQHTRDLVERLACCVVSGAAQNLKVGVIAHQHDQRVTTRGHKRQKGRLQVGKFQIIGRDVSADVVYRNKRFAQRKRQRFAEVCTDQHCADESRCAGRSDRVHLVRLHARLFQCTFGHAHDRFHVTARSDLGHDTAVQRVRLDLRVNDIG